MSHPEIRKALIIRFSSFGDINQCLFAAEAIRKEHPECQIDWLTRSDFGPYLEQFSGIHRVYPFDRKRGFRGLMQQAWELRKQKYDLVYDAHNNLRSIIIKLLMGWPFAGGVITRGKDRLKRLLLFKFRINRFPDPFVGADSYLRPLGSLVSQQEIPVPRLKKTKAAIENYTVIAPAAAWPLKQWELEQWKEYLNSTPDKIKVLGGPNDKWLQELSVSSPNQVENLAGKLSWIESLYTVAGAQKVVGVDTGITHLGDLLGKPTAFIIGPSAFGYPKRQSSQVFETQLWCKPCSKDGRGKCVNKEYKKCLKEVTPAMVGKF